MQIIPAIDIRDSKAVRLTQGDFNQETIYSQDPSEVALAWESQGAKMIHLVDLDGAKNGKITNLNSIKQILDKVNIPVEVGGGIRGKESVKELLSLGVSRVILGTTALEDQELLKNLLEKYPGKVVVGLDAKNGKVLKRGWLEDSGQNLMVVTKELESLGVKTFIVTDTSKDGTLTEPNFDQIKSLVQNSSAAIIASGGVSSVDDIKKLKELGAVGVILGKSLYEGRINLKEALNVG